ncbi:response regulator transcription factor [Paenibacillus sp. S150]|uniref:response regulator transcription factor n=1 Tax=Paenibacillus sp. S150 TaxID=2749826 RepID=UPI001C598FBF|nr:response regulator transcription factor [Paenibacillus sp. S150]MBW4083090.1 response regulator transcription factor [Paenibacillus sp. S150]
MNELCRVLIVDDEILVRQGIKYVLDWEREGFQIVGEASNGQEALGALHTLKPHILITDIVMPVMDGEELTRIVKRDYPAMEVIVLSSFSEFDYVRSTFQNGVADYILKPRLAAGALLQVLQKTRDRIPALQAKPAFKEQRQSPESLLSRLISGYELQAEDAGFLAQQFPHGQFCFLGCGYAGTLPHGEQPAEPPFRTAIAEALSRRLPGMVQLLIPAAGQNRLLLINLEAAQWGEAVLALQELARTYAGNEPGLRFSLSRAFGGISGAAAVYQDSYLKLQQYRFYFPGEVLLVHDELPPLAAEPPKFNLGQFTEQLKRLQLEEAFAELRRHVAELRSYYDNDVFQYKSFLGNIIFNVTNQFGHIKALEDEKYDLFRSIDEAPHAEAAAGLLDAFLDRVMEESFLAAPAAGSHANMKKLLEYIEEHYAEPLSLTELARHFHFNPSYLSSLFTAHNQEGFKEHLNTVRTDRAAELLRAGEAPISEISSMVGYGDHSYFCKVFKKYTGLSPSGYRRQFYGQE